MPSPDSSSCGPNPVPNPGASSRKEKKKQAKEERDRLKQVEKKKRRLEKALATAAAIRIELEQKKQKRKEEEQRLDEEGAALAESVALQVLVEEDTDVLGSSVGTENEVFEDRGGSFRLGNEAKSRDTGCSSFGNSLMSPGQSFDLKQQICFTYMAAVAAADGKVESTSKNLYSSCETSMKHTFGHLNKDKHVKLEELHVEKAVVTDCEIFSNPEDNLKASTERAKAAEVAAGMAAAQAVAALRIAEEARAEAEAAKKAAEAAISQVLDRKQLSNIDEFALQVNFQPRNAEIERDELKARLEETKRQLKEKTRQVVHLEQNLEDMTHYLLQLKGTLPFVMTGAEREGETSEKDSTNVAESSGGTVDQ